MKILVVLAMLLISPRQTDFQRINEVRIAHGVGIVKMNSVLTARAQHYAETIAHRGLLTDDTAQNACLRAGGKGWYTSNTGFAPTVSYIQTLMEKSKIHLRNMIDRRFTMVGIGLAWGYGNWWLVQEYCG